MEKSWSVRDREGAREEMGYDVGRNEEMTRQVRSRRSMRSIRTTRSRKWR
jgi:hypothetical protein